MTSSMPSRRAGDDHCLLIRFHISTVVLLQLRKAVGLQIWRRRSVSGRAGRRGIRAGFLHLPVCESRAQIGFGRGHATRPNLRGDSWPFQDELEHLRFVHQVSGDPRFIRRDCPDRIATPAVRCVVLRLSALHLSGENGATHARTVFRSPRVSWSRAGNHHPRRCSGGLALCHSSDRSRRWHDPDRYAPRQRRSSGCVASGLSPKNRSLAPPRRARRARANPAARGAADDPARRRRRRSNRCVRLRNPLDSALMVARGFVEGRRSAMPDVNLSDKEIAAEDRAACQECQGVRASFGRSHSLSQRGEEERLRAAAQVAAGASHYAARTLASWFFTFARLTFPRKHLVKQSLVEG